MSLAQWLLELLNAKLAKEELSDLLCSYGPASQYSMNGQIIYKSLSNGMDFIMIIIIFRMVRMACYLSLVQMNLSLQMHHL